MARGGFPGMMGGANMQQLARQAQKLQQQMTKMQEELDAREFEATSGGGMVTAKVNGKRELLALTIKPEAVDPDDVEADTAEREMGKLTGGMGMPGLF